jgi:quinol monooxygenase YgiN
MMVVTEYLTKPGKRRELFELFDRLLASQRAPGRDLVIWSTSTVERDASYMIEYWSDAAGFARVFDMPWYLEYVIGVDELVRIPPSTVVSVPVFIEGV